MNSNKGLKIAAKQGIQLRQDSQFIFKWRQVRVSCQGSLKIHIYLTATGQGNPDWLPAWWTGAMWSSWYQYLVQLTLEAACQAPLVLWSHLATPVTLQDKGKSCLSLWHSGVVFSLKSKTAQQTGTQMPWRSDLLLLPCGKAEFQIDLLVLPSRRCLGMT